MENLYLDTHGTLAPANVYDTRTVGYLIHKTNLVYDSVKIMLYEKSSDIREVIQVLRVVSWFVYIDTSNNRVFHYRHMDYPIPDVMIHAPDEVYNYFEKILNEMTDKLAEDLENEESMV